MRACVRASHMVVATRLLYVNARIWGVLCHIVVISSKLNCRTVTNNVRNHCC